jgi:hypothetical protein
MARLHDRGQPKLALEQELGYGVLEIWQWLAGRIARQRVGGHTYPGGSVLSTSRNGQSQGYRHTVFFALTWSLGRKYSGLQVNDTTKI